MTNFSSARTGEERLLRNISDTALWTAVFRAQETERPDALFRDPLAQRLAGERGKQIAASMGFRSREAWSFVARTWAFDRIIEGRIQQGTDMVINLAAGLDTRPYRMALPASLDWVEVDLPAIIDYKDSVLAQEKPVCSLERVRLDLANERERCDLFARLGARARKALVLCEGLIVYLSREEVAGLARDLAAQHSFQAWATDLASPGLLKMLQKKIGDSVAEAGSPLKFAPEEGLEFFEPYGWKAVEVYSMLKTAAQLKRLPFILRLFAMLPEAKGRQGSRIWGGVCLLART